MLTQLNNPLIRASDITYLTENQLNALTEALSCYSFKDYSLVGSIELGQEHYQENQTSSTYQVSFLIILYSVAVITEVTDFFFFFLVVLSKKTKNKK